MTRIDFSQYVEYVTEGPVVHPVALEQHDLGNPLTLAALAEGYAHVEQLGRKPTLDSAALDALKTAASEHYAADVIDNEIVSGDPAQVVDRLLWVRSRPEWYVGLQVVAADAERTVGVYFNPADGNLYRCITPHVTQADWRPDLPGVDALWARFYEPEDGPQPWVQPAGAHDAYNIGDRVTFEGNIYESLIDANVWSPTAYPQGWQLIGPA